MTRNNWPRTLLRLPLDAHAFLKKQAELNASSLNSEIVRCVREKMAHEPSTHRTMLRDTITN